MTVFINAIVPSILPSTKKTNSKFIFIPVSKKDLVVVISTFENKYSTGIDDIPMTLLIRSSLCIF